MSRSIRKIGESYSKKHQKSICEVCEGENIEIRILLKKLLKRLLSKRNQGGEQFQCLKKNTSENCTETFKRLINITVGKRSSSGIFNCIHKKIFQSFQRKLRCPQNSLIQICEQIIYQIANRNYQLDILTKQIQHIEQRVSQILAAPFKNKNRTSQVKQEETRLDLRRQGSPVNSLPLDNQQWELNPLYPQNQTLLFYSFYMGPLNSENNHYQ